MRRIRPEPVARATPVTDPFERLHAGSIFLCLDPDVAAAVRRSQACHPASTPSCRGNPPATRRQP